MGCFFLGGKEGGENLLPHQGNQKRPEDEVGEGDVEKENSDEACPGDDVMKGRKQGFLGNLDQGQQHDGHHRRLQPVEKGGHPGDGAEGDVGHAQPQQDKHGGQHEQDAGRQPPAHPVQEPAQVSGQLLGLRARQQHAVVEGVQKLGVRHPLLLVHDKLLHDADLPGRPAKGDEPQFEPEEKRIPERGFGDGRRGSVCCCHDSPTCLPEV
ncbi:hypothetical protein BH24BAC1_BH24BAC1_15030 [soil metagenome]